MLLYFTIFAYALAVWNNYRLRKYLRLLHDQYTDSRREHREEIVSLHEETARWSSKVTELREQLQYEANLRSSKPTQLVPLGNHGNPSSTKPASKTPSVTQEQAKAQEAIRLRAYTQEIRSRGLTEKQGKHLRGTLKGYGIALVSTEDHPERSPAEAVIRGRREAEEHWKQVVHTYWALTSETIPVPDRDLAASNPDGVPDPLLEAFDALSLSMADLNPEALHRTLVVLGVESEPTDAGTSAETGVDAKTAEATKAPVDPLIARVMERMDPVNAPKQVTPKPPARPVLVDPPGVWKRIPGTEFEEPVEQVEVVAAGGYEVVGRVR